MAPANQQLCPWAAGLVVSTTCMQQDEKHDVKRHVEAAGGRYSPNLSKRTTHLITPVIVSNASQKLLAATTENRYPGLHVVNSQWLEASMQSMNRANEAGHQPDMQQVPSGSNDPYITPAANSTSSRQPNSVSATPTTAAAPQTPWVVHFSQMGDSIYGMPDTPSPSGHKQLVQQLLPIAESPSPRAGGISMATQELGARDAGSADHHTQQELQLAAGCPALNIAAQQLLQSRRDALSPTTAVAASSPSCGAHRPQPLQLVDNRSSLLSDTAVVMAHTSSSSAAGTPVAQPATLLQKLHVSTRCTAPVDHVEQQHSPSSLHRPPPLQLGDASTSCPPQTHISAAGDGTGRSDASRPCEQLTDSKSPACAGAASFPRGVPRHHEQKQQQQQKHEHLLAAMLHRDSTGPHMRFNTVGELRGGAPFPGTPLQQELQQLPPPQLQQQHQGAAGNAGSIDQLLQALRSSAGGSRGAGTEPATSTSSPIDIVASPGTRAEEAAVASGFSGSSSVRQLLGALHRSAGGVDSRRTATEATRAGGWAGIDAQQTHWPAAGATAEQQKQQQHILEASDAGHAKRTNATELATGLAVCNGKHFTCDSSSGITSSSVSDLIGALKRVTGEVDAGKAAPTAAPGSVAPVAFSAEAVGQLAHAPTRQQPHTARSNSPSTSSTSRCASRRVTQPELLQHAAVAKLSSPLRKGTSDVSALIKALRKVHGSEDTDAAPAALQISNSATAQALAAVGAAAARTCQQHLHHAAAKDFDGLTRAFLQGTGQEDHRDAAAIACGSQGQLEQQQQTAGEVEQLVHVLGAVTNSTGSSNSTAISPRAPTALQQPQVPCSISPSTTSLLSALSRVTQPELLQHSAAAQVGIPLRKGISDVSDLMRALRGVSGPGSNIAAAAVSNAFESPTAALKPCRQSCAAVVAAEGGPLSPLTLSRGQETSRQCTLRAVEDAAGLQEPKEQLDQTLRILACPTADKCSTADSAAASIVHHPMDELEPVAAPLPPNSSKKDGSRNTALQSFSSVEELVAALRRATGDSRRGAAEAAVAEAAAVPLLQSQPSQHTPAVGAASAGLSTAACPPLAPGIAALKENTSSPEHAVTDAAAGVLDATGTKTTHAAGSGCSILHDQHLGAVRPVDGAAAAAAAAPDADVQEDARNGLGSIRGVDELIGALHRVTGDSLKVAQDPAAEDELTKPSTTTATAVGTAKDSSQVTENVFGSISNVDDLIQALHRATNSRRSTAEAAVDTATGQLQQQQQQQEAADDDVGFGGCETVDDLLKALSRVSSDSRRGKSDLGVSADQGDPHQQQRQQRSDDGVFSDPATSGAGSLLGSFGGMDELLTALRRATGNSRRTSAETAVPAGGEEQQEKQHSPGVGSVSSLEDLLTALRRTTGDSRRGTAETVVAAATAQGTAVNPAAACEVKQQQHDGIHISASGKALAFTQADPPAGLLEAGGQREQQSPCISSNTHELAAALQAASSNSTRRSMAEAASPAVHISSIHAGTVYQTTQKQERSLPAEPQNKAQRLVATDVRQDAANDRQVSATSAGLHRPIAADVCAGRASSEAVAAAATHAAQQQRHHGTCISAEGSSGDATAVLNSSSSRSSSPTPYRFPTSTQQEQPTCGSSAGSIAAASGNLPCNGNKQCTGPNMAQQVAMGGNRAASSLAHIRDSVCSTISAVMDPALPAKVQQQLHAAITAAGATVVPGQPHLGCGANTVIAEPDRAAIWLPLLLDVVSPAWVLKACQQQKAQQLVQLSPDIARALGGWLQQLDCCQAAAGSAAAANGRACSPDGDSGASVLCAGSCSSSEVIVLAAAAAAAQRPPMPRQLLTDLIWSIDQHPRCVGDEEAAAVLFQSGISSISLLLPQDSSGALGFHTVTCSASQTARGLTCSDLLTAIHSFYQQKVMVREQPASNCSSSPQQQQRVMHRVELLGTRLMFEGLLRATQDPHSSLYEVCLA